MTTSLLRTLPHQLAKNNGLEAKPANNITHLSQFKFQTVATFIMMLATRSGNKDKKCPPSQTKAKLTPKCTKDRGVIAPKKAKLGGPDGKENEVEVEDDILVDSIALMTNNNIFVALQNFDLDDDDEMDPMKAGHKQTSNSPKNDDNQDKVEVLEDLDDDDNTLIIGIWEDAETQKIVKEICHKTKEAEKEMQASNSKKQQENQQKETYTDAVGKPKDDDDFMMSEEEAQAQAVKEATAAKKRVDQLSKPKKSKKKTGRVSIGGTMDTQIYDTKDENIKWTNDAYMMMIVEPPESKAAEHIEMIVAMVKHIYKLILMVDQHAIIYMYDDTSKDKITSDKVIASLEKFPMNLTILKKFFHGLQVSDNDKMFLNLCIAMDKDAAKLVKTAHSLLQHAKDKDIPESCNANWYSRHLQVPFSEDAGWIAGFFYNCNAEELQGILQSLLDYYTDKNNEQYIPIIICTKEPKLAFNISKPKKSEEEKKKQNYAAKTMHVEVSKGDGTCASHYIGCFIKHTKVLKQCTNMHLIWVPNVTCNSGHEDMAYAREGFGYHKSAFNSANYSKVLAVKFLDVTSKCLGNKTLCQLILELDLPSRPGTKALLYAEQGYDGITLIYYAKAWTDEAKDIIKFLLLHLCCKYPEAGSAIDKGFSSAVIANADDYIWDEQKNCLVSLVTKDLLGIEDLFHVYFSCFCVDASVTCSDVRGAYILIALWIIVIDCEWNCSECEWNVNGLWFDCLCQKKMSWD